MNTAYKEPHSEDTTSNRSTLVKSTRCHSARQNNEYVSSVSITSNTDDIELPVRRSAEQYYDDLIFCDSTSESNEYVPSVVNNSKTPMTTKFPLQNRLKNDGLFVNEAANERPVQTASKWTQNKILILILILCLCISSSLVFLLCAWLLHGIRTSIIFKCLKY
jgi:hypothetical protein